MKYAFVSGSTSGIGLAIAEKLLSEDCYVFINYFTNVENARLAEQHLATISANFQVIQADMSSLIGIQSVSEFIKSNCSQLDYLILNSYATDKTPFPQVTFEQWQHVMNTNVNMPFFIMQQLYEHMAEGGSVVCVGSMMGTHPHAVSTSYGVSKAALHMLCKSMVKIYAPKGIRINAVSPGFVETAMQENKTHDHRRRIERKIALQRFAMPKEVADFSYSVLTNSYVNGSVIPICGGYDMV